MYALKNNTFLKLIFKILINFTYELFPKFNT